MRGAGKNQEKKIPEFPIRVRVLLESEKKEKKGKKEGKKEKKGGGSPRARPNYRLASVSRFTGSNALLIKKNYR
jgi:hypothetical protein